LEFDDFLIESAMLVLHDSQTLRGREILVSC